tara:strand:+ start:498 stop:671 length:174 start_codon:yes stop_codon:yes gene_type:complete
MPGDTFATFAGARLDVSAIGGVALIRYILTAEGRVNGFGAKPILDPTYLHCADVVYL